MTDDFHGTFEWEIVMQSMRKVFPDRAVVDIDSREPIFHVLYNLDDKFQVPGVATLGPAGLMNMTVWNRSGAASTTTRAA